MKLKMNEPESKTLNTQSIYKFLRMFNIKSLNEFIFLLEQNKQFYCYRNDSNGIKILLYIASLTKDGNISIFSVIDSSERIVLKKEYFLEFDKLNLPKYINAGDLYVEKF